MNNLQVALGSFGKRVLYSTREGFAHLIGALGNRRLLTTAVEPAAAADDDETVADGEPEVRGHLTEKGISSQLLRISALAVILKALHYLVDHKWLPTVTSAISGLLGAPFWVWAMITNLTWAFVPLICGVAMAVVTWYTVFLDRCIPGIYPPSPVSARKHWFSPPSTFHLGHAIALVNGAVLIILTYFGWDSASNV